jgi:hypothetical protein
MNESYEIDYDQEAIHLDGSWLQRDELAAKIRGLLEAGEYRVSRLSHALEALEAALAEARLLSVRLPPSLAKAVEAWAERSGKGVGALVREVLAAQVEENRPQPTLQVLGKVDGRWFEG